MKKISLLMLLALVACSPMLYQVEVESRGPSKSGLDLAGKSLAVVYDGVSGRPAFSHAFAEGFAAALEKDYFDGEKAVGIYTIDEGDYSPRDSMVSLVMQTDADVVFLLQQPSFSQLAHSDGQTLSSLEVNMLAYDSMAGERDKVRRFNGTINVTAEGTLDEERFRPAADSQAPDIGAKAASTFLSTWRKETYGIYYYDSFEEGWYNGLREAVNFKWEEAIKLWMGLLTTRSRERKASAEYNIALGCYLLGDLELATKWLDRADKDCPLTLSPQLRKIIEAKKK